MLDISAVTFFLALAESYGMICDGMFHIFNASGYGDELSAKLLHEWLDVDIKNLFFLPCLIIDEKSFSLFRLTPRILNNRILKGIRVESLQGSIGKIGISIPRS